ncbi:uncharacterized protein LOC121779175 [Salvia splendens]|uniref:uncharacterized protein LOC121779175 n=1 Tax=Salvia splendens TaxID=180675 RepID=UPI001C2667D9|nr:uncharacterized protein LOC121779175 [Salvia splendens]
MENAPGNCRLISPIIQNDIINCCAKETTKRIVDDLGEDCFAILADESIDVSQKEQLALCLGYVEKKVERSAILALLAEHSLSPSKIRGQGYDGASNMKVISKRNDECIWLFDNIAILLNVIGVSCKRREMIREIQAQKIAKALEVDELKTWTGLNQELGLKRPGDTRWSSHYKTLLNVMDLFSAIVNVLVIIGKNGSSDDKAKAQGVLY